MSAQATVEKAKGAVKRALAAIEAHFPLAAGNGARAMAPRPDLMRCEWVDDGWHDQKQPEFPEKNAVIGRTLKVVVCADCGAAMLSRKQGVEHAALEGHRVELFYRGEIVPVDRRQHWADWVDGAGVSYRDRYPQADAASPLFNGGGD